MRTVAIVPVRAPGEGKSRLAGVLSPLRRASLVQGMLIDHDHAPLALGHQIAVVQLQGGRRATREHAL